MNQSNDVYTKPTKPFSEYVNIGVVSVLFMVFLTVEAIDIFKSKQETGIFVAKDVKKIVIPKAVVKTVVNVPAKKASKKPKVKSLLATAKNGTLADFRQRLEQNNTSMADLNTTFTYVYKHKSRDFLYEIAVRTQATTQHKAILSRFISATKRLSDAKKLQELTEVKALLKKGYVLEPNYPYATTLIRNRQYAMVKLLIESNNINVTAHNVYGYTLLHEATAKGHLKLIDLLCAKGEDINKQANDGVSVLHYPVRLGYKLTVAKLLKLGVNPNLQATLHYNGLDWNKTAPLHIAALKGDVKMVELLVKNGASLTLTNGAGKTAFDIALEHNNTALLPLLKTPIF